VVALIADNQASGALPPDVGVALAVVKDSQVLFSGTYGLRERDRRLPVTPQTVFEIGSLTKAFTATALVTAAEHGEIDIEGPVNAKKRLLQLSDAHTSHHISVADILSHRTGVAAMDLLWYLGSLRAEEALVAASRLPVVSGAFRRSFIYHNILYGVLGNLFGQLIGEQWEASIRRRLLVPLEMSSTFFHPTLNGPDIALPYVGTRCVPRIDLTGIAAAGGMRSTLDDMTRWLTFQSGVGATAGGDQLLSQAALSLMRTKHNQVQEANPLLLQGWEWVGQEVYYGFGWVIASMAGLQLVFHPGYIDGFSTAAAFIPEMQLGMVVLMNTNLSSVPGMFVKTVFEACMATNTTMRIPEASSSSPRRHAVVGTYYNDVFGTIAVEDRGEEELLLRYKQHAWPLAWRGDTAADFVITAFGMEVPLTIQFDDASNRATTCSIPLALDPRSPAQVFIRT
jgi:CubicO group peptidase (beta-lactamase class C family)